MPVQDWSSTADENTSIDGINIAEHCPAKNINNAIRSVMASVKKNDASVVHTAGAETITGTKTFTETIAGTAAAAEKLATARTITLSGAASGSISFDGSADATLEVSIRGNQGAVIGEIRWFAMSTPPEGWLVCNGATVFTSNYAALFAAIGKTFTPRLTSTDPDVENPEYSDPTVFRLPNLIGKVPWGSSSQVGTEMKAGVPNINGSLTVVGDSAESNWVSNTQGQGAFYDVVVNSNRQYYAHCVYSDNGGTCNQAFDASRSNSIYGKSSTVQPPALCLLPCIRYE